MISAEIMGERKGSEEKRKTKKMGTKEMMEGLMGAKVREEKRTEGRGRGGC